MLEGWIAQRVDGRDHEALEAALAPDPARDAAALRRRGGGGEMTTMRERFYELAREALDEDERVAVVTAQIGADAIGEHPRHFDVGIREQLMIGVAAGLALEGYRPVVTPTRRSSSSGRTSSSSSTSATTTSAPCSSAIGASYDAAHEGRTHQAPEDVALVAALPGWTIHVPGHADEARAAVPAGARRRRPCLHPAERGDEPRAGRRRRLIVLRRGSPGAPLVVAVGPTLDPGARGDRRPRRHGRVPRDRAPVPARRSFARRSRRHRRRPRRAVPRRHLGGRDRRRAPRPAAPAARARRPERGVPPLRHGRASTGPRTGSTPQGSRASSTIPGTLRV